MKQARHWGTKQKEALLSTCAHVLPVRGASSISMPHPSPSPTHHSPAWILTEKGFEVCLLILMAAQEGSQDFDSFDFSSCGGPAEKVDAQPHLKSSPASGNPCLTTVCFFSQSGASVAHYCCCCQGEAWRAEEKGKILGPYQLILVCQLSHNPLAVDPILTSISLSFLPCEMGLLQA